MDGNEASCNVDAATPNEDTPSFILRAYNVPPSYTVQEMDKLIHKRIPKANIDRIIPPYPWQDKSEISWKVICADKNTHRQILTEKHFYLSKEMNGRYEPAVTFMEGDPLDIMEIPTKADETLLLNEYLETRQNS